MDEKMERKLVKLKSEYLGREIEMTVGEVNDTDVKKLLVPHDELLHLVHDDPDCKANGVKYHFVDVSLNEPGHYAVRCVMHDNAGRRVELPGESTHKTRKTTISQEYPYTMASKRAFDAAAIAFLGFEGKILSDAQVDDADEEKTQAVPTTSGTGAPTTSRKRGPRKTSKQQKEVGVTEEAGTEQTNVEQSAAPGSKKEKSVSEPPATPSMEQQADTENESASVAAPAAQKQNEQPADLAVTPENAAQTVDTRESSSKGSVKLSIEQAEDHTPEAVLDVTAAVTGGHAVNIEAEHEITPTTASQPQEQETTQPHEETASAGFAADINSEEYAEILEFMKSGKGEFKDPEDPYSLVIRFGSLKQKNMTIRQAAKEDPASMRWLATFRTGTPKGQMCQKIVRMYMKEHGMDLEEGDCAA